MSISLPQITELFLKYGMDVSKPRIPYDDNNSIHPMRSLGLGLNENSIKALKLLLDNGLDLDSAAVCWGQYMFDQINVCRDDPNGELNYYFAWAIKSIMLIASYDYILKEDEDLRKFIAYDHNDYDIKKFRKWDDFSYEFDTSRCERYPEIYKAIVIIRETKTNCIIWRFGVCLKQEEYL